MVSNESENRVLFFANLYMGYEKIIAEEMQKRGYKIDMFDECSIQKGYQKALIKMFGTRIYKRKTQRYYDAILKKIEGKQYDIVFFIKCDMPTEQIMEKLRAHFPMAKFCLYLWDSLRNTHDRYMRKKFRFFDVIHTFDRQDSIREHIGFRPLFFTNEYRYSANEGASQYQYDFCFIGTVHSDRYRLLKELAHVAQETGLTYVYYMYLQKKYVFWFYKFTDRCFQHAHIREFHFEKLSVQQTIEMLARSKAVVDIAHPMQSGLTIRSIEAMGMGKKLITTNEDIRNYDFYIPQNVLIIDRQNPTPDRTFFGEPYVEVSPEIYERYSIQSWLDDVLGLNA